VIESVVPLIDSLPGAATKLRLVSRRFRPWGCNYSVQERDVPVTLCDLLEPLTGYRPQTSLRAGVGPYWPV
jgi:hypothetical protein